MYLKKAMVITNSLGVSDYVQDGVNSLLVPVGDADALARGFAISGTIPSGPTNSAPRGSRSRGRTAPSSRSSPI